MPLLEGAPLLAGIAVIWSLIRLERLRRDLAATTLKPAVHWAMAAAAAWLLWLMWVAVTVPRHDFRWTDGLTHTAYIAAVLSLCPPMLVLGARRPTNRAWMGFVIVPMIVVLSWPVITLALHGGWRRLLVLETPHFIGYLLVLVMSYGNYVGGSLTFSALLCGAALATIAASSAQEKSSLDEAVGPISLAVFILSLGVLSGIRRWRKRSLSDNPLDRVWQEFSLLYGLVWSRRVLDRVNAIAVKQQWPGRLHADGFHWDRPLDETTRQQVEHALRWLLRRFVDPEWLDARLGHGAADPGALTIDT